MARRGRPTTANPSADALRKRELRAGSKARRVSPEARTLKLTIVLTMELAEAWLEIMKEEAAENSRVLPSWTSTRDREVLETATQEFVELRCSNHIRGQGEAKLDGIYNVRVGTVERDVPPELKSNGAPVRKRVEREPYTWAKPAGDQRKDPLLNPRGVKKDKGRSLSAGTLDVDPKLASYAKQLAEEFEKREKDRQDEQKRREEYPWLYDSGFFNSDQEDEDEDGVVEDEDEDNKGGNEDEDDDDED